MIDEHIMIGGARANAVAEEILASFDYFVASLPQDPPAAADNHPSSIGFTCLDARELRHELLNALTAASGYTQRPRWRSAGWADGRDRRALEVIQQSIGHTSHLLQDDWGRKQGLRLGLRRIVDEAVSQVPPLRLAGVVVRILTEEPLVGRWDRQRIVGVLVNVLDNAVKYSPPGMPIVIEITREGDQARITVRDRGIGIEDKDLAAIFDGHRTELARTVAEGSGIGLRLSRRLVHAEGGQLGVASHPGSGSACWVTLPLATESLTATSARTGGYEDDIGPTS